MDGSSVAIQGLNSFEWNAEFHGAFSLISRLAAVARDRANVLRLAKSLRGANKTLRTMFAKTYAAMEGKIPPDPEAQDLTPQQVRELADQVERMANMIGYTYESLRRAGLTNNSLTAGALKTFYEYREPLLDLAEWLELNTHPAEVEAIFARSQRERESGEITDLQQVE